MSNLTIIPRDYNGATVQQRADGYWNATAMCKANGKEWSGYYRNQATQEFLGELESVLQIHRTELIQTQQGGTPELQGTWVHRRVALHLAQWCSPRFAVKVSEWVEELLTTGTVSIDRPKTQAELLLAQCQALVDQERRLASVESRVQRIEAERQEASQALLTLEPPERPAPEKSLRARVNELVRLYCTKTGAGHRDAWGRLYREVFYRCHFNSRLRAKNTGLTQLDCIERAGLIADLYAIAVEVLAF